MGNVNASKALKPSLIVIAALILIAIAARSWTQQRFRSQLASALVRLERGEPSLALSQLSRLARDYPDSAAVRLAIGQAQEALERPEKALAVWESIGPEHPEHLDAVSGQARASAALGRFAAAERLALAVLERDPSPRLRDSAEMVLERLWRFEGRLDETRTLLRERCRRSDRPEEVLRVLWRLDDEPFPIDGARQVLEQARRANPDDDRVQLGLARLAILTGAFDDAKAWLDPCLSQRPDNPAVASAVRDWEFAKDQTGTGAGVSAEARRGAKIEIKLRWAASLAQQRGDARAEEDWLRELVKAAPGRADVWDRLAELALARGDADQVRHCRDRKTEIARAMLIYRRALDLDGPIVPSEDLARAADVLGRRFEAACWRALAALAPLSSIDPRAGDQLPNERLAELDRMLDGMAAPGDLGPGSPKPPTRIEFEDVAASVGIAFQFRAGGSKDRQMPETMSGGVALFDSDGDGWLDVLALQGGAFPPKPVSGVGGASEDRLFRNRGDGLFEDATERSGLSSLSGGYAHGVAIGDYDNDGDPDVFLTRWDSYRLLRNRGGGRFEDATAASGLGGPQSWPTSAAFADLDNDGDLDLYVCHYLKWDAANPRVCRNSESGRVQYCDPRLFEAVPDRLWRNDDGRFVDVSREAGIVDRDGRGLGVLAADCNDDGLVDLFIANDTTANALFLNRGGMRFEEAGHESGVAGNAEGGYQAGMGVAIADFDGDGRSDLAVTNFYGESTSLFRQLAPGFFADRTAASGLRSASRYLLGFGVAAGDFQNDGRADLLTANGHVNDLSPAAPYAMPMQVLAGAEEGKLIDATPTAGADVAAPRIGRGLAIGDWNRDGRLDAVVVALDRPLACLRNSGTSAAHFVRFSPQGTKSNRDGVGAKVTLRAGGRTQTAQRFGGGGYLSASEPFLHFGLGDSAAIDWVDVRWPSGKIERWSGRDLPADRVHTLLEGDPKAALR